DGVLAPLQLVPPGGALVIDLRDGELRATTWSDALQRVHAAGARIAEAPITADEEGKFLVDALVGGRRVTVEIDTGSPSTTLFVKRESDLPDRLIQIDQRRVRLQAGEVEADVELERLQPLSGGGRSYDGLLGMDVLRGCVLALDGAQMVAGC